MVERSTMVSVKDLRLCVGEFCLESVSLSIERGEYFILLGPTGCGKTLMVESICGLNMPDAGSIYIDGRDVTNTDPATRRIGYVPQDYALLPFKTVEQNIAFGLQARKMGRKQIRESLDAVCEMLEIGHLRRRFPSHLSGGERQRVALGRALAIEPDVLVLDEPLSALDEGTCRELMGRLKNLHDHLNTTFIHICHRLEEAFTLGDTLGLMRGGRIEQIGPTGRLIAEPRNLFVARFLQLRNLTRGEIRETAEGNVFFINDVPLCSTEKPAGAAYCIIPVPELSIAEHDPGDEDGYVVLSDRIAENSNGYHEPGLRFRGRIDLTIPGIFPPDKWPPGKKVYIRFQRSGLHILAENEHH